MGYRRWKGVLGIVLTLLCGGVAAWHARDSARGAIRVTGEVAAVQREGRSRRAIVRVPEGDPYFGSYAVDCYIWPPREGAEVTLLLKPSPYGAAQAELAGWRGVWALPLAFGLPCVFSLLRIFWPGRR